MDLTDNSFDKVFEDWKNNFPCPKCGMSRLDLSTNQNIKAPIICTNCFEQFNFIQQTDLLKRLDSVILSLETSQSVKYSAMTSLVLSYLYDIKNNTVPKWIQS